MRREVTGVLECTSSCTFEWRGKPVNLKGTEDGRPGTLVSADHPVIRGHEHVFRPFMIELAFDPGP